MNLLYQVKDLVKVYEGGPTRLTVLDGLNLDVSRGEMAAIIGASGSGKTTLLQILGALAKPNSGSLIFDGKEIGSFTEKELAHLRNHRIGFIFQFHHLLPEFSALENVVMPALISGKKQRDVEGEARKLLDEVELSDRIHHRVGELSGGEQQRTALARALIMNPSLLLADEPTGNLDERAGNIIFALLQKLCRDRGLSVVMVTHNLDLAEKMDQIHRLQKGKLVF